MKTIKHYLTHPNEFVAGVIVKLNRLFPNDELYLKLLFRCLMKQKLNLNNPKTFSEKLQWLKLYNRKPEYTTMVDKYAVKEYVANKIGKEYIIPTFGVWNSVDEIDFDSLPNKFVLKTTHAGGGNGVVICKDKFTFNRNSAMKKLSRSMKTNPYYTLREWPYKNVKKRIIAEQLIEVKGQQDLLDYKFFCFNGEPKYCQVISARNKKMSIDFYDENWKHQPFLRKQYPHSEQPNPKPISFNKMWDLAKELSCGQPFLRVDFYEVNGSIYFGELTFYPTSGFGGFEPKEWDYKFGSWIELPNK